MRSRALGPGDRLGKYQLIRQIAVGGMAELYLARTHGIEGFEKLVVVKRILPQYVANESFVEMFLNEARLAATLHHPNVAQVYDIGLDEGDYFFAMEYVHGEDLFRIGAMANEQGVPISMDAALTIAAGLCAGLHYAHEKASGDGKPLEIVHRDVSPSNVLVSYDGAVKLVDFGIARASTRQTTGTGLKGKVWYMSPEQCKTSGSLDRRSDIYSVGVVLYELTTGQLPHEGKTDYEILSNIVNTDARPPSSIVPEYPPALEKIVLRALSRDPALRYATALLLQGELEDFAHENRLRVSPLVLARFIGTLFPERIEEWSHAKTQGAFFVEQHVVRTLIEAGKTPDPEEQKLRMQIAAEEEKRLAQQAAQVSDDDVTNVNDTVMTPPPIMIGDQGSAPAQAPPPKRAKTPVPPNAIVPNMPGAVPIMPGTLYSAKTPPDAMPRVTPGSIDVTERVRVPQKDGTKTTFVRAVSRRNLVLGLGAIVGIAGALAAMIALRGGDDAAPVGASSAPAVAPPPAVVQPAATPPTPTPPTPTPTLTPTPIEVAPTPAPIVETKPKPEPKPVHRATVHATPKLHAKSKSEEPKPEPPKEKPWSADSPFMPVRTDKH